MDKVLAECKDPDYWFAASRDGNRESHYRGVLRSRSKPQPQHVFGCSIVSNDYIASVPS